MYTNILIPLDASPLAEGALGYARALAHKTGARLTLIRAAKQPASAFGDRGYEQLRAIREAEDYLAHLASTFTTEGFAVDTGVPFGGDPGDWIVEEAAFRHADLIVMASHNRVGVDHWLHGSVAEGVVHRAECPVMLVKAAAPYCVAERLASAMPTLVVPLDGSELAEFALPVATQMATALGAHIALVSIVPSQTPLVAGPTFTTATFSETEYTAMVDDARDYLRSVERSLEASGISTEHVVRIGDAALEIASIAQQHRAATVVMATHGRAGLVRAMLGSVAGAVVRCGNTPVVLVRPDRPQRILAAQSLREVAACAAF
ncbi:MAG: universal stress protein [Chloroflexi bacterium]|nr:universal stress protein [Chloroflexota bacterium]